MPRAQSFISVTYGSYLPLHTIKILFPCLRRNVEASCHTLLYRFPPSTNSAAYQRLVSTTRRGPSHRVYYTCCSKRTQHAMEPYIGWKSRFLFTYLYSTPPLGGFPSEYCHDVRYGNASFLFDGEKILKIYLFFLTESTNVSDKRTDRRADTARRRRPCLCTASRGKNRVHTHGNGRTNEGTGREHYGSLDWWRLKDNTDVADQAMSYTSRHLSSSTLHQYSVKC